MTELDRRHTHDIGFWPANRMIAHSAGRGWRNVYAALATVDSWSGSLAPTGHPCIAYCVNRPANLRTRNGSSGQHETHIVRPRQFFVIPAHEESEWDRRGASDMLMLYLRQDLIDALARQQGHGGGDPFDLALGLGTIDPLLEQIALALLEILRGPEDGSSALYADGLVQAMILHLLRRQAVPLGARPPSRPVAIGGGLGRAVHLVEAAPGADWSIAALAQAAGLGCQSFARSFQRVFGTTVHQYVLARRLDLAKRLLSSTDEPIVEIALQAGFASQSHLSTAFKRLTGLTPGDYRGQNRTCCAGV